MLLDEDDVSTVVNVFVSSPKDLMLEVAASVVVGACASTEEPVSPTRLCDPVSSTSENHSPDQAGGVASSNL